MFFEEIDISAASAASVIEKPYWMLIISYLSTGAEILLIRIT